MSPIRTAAPSAQTGRMLCAVAIALLLSACGDPKSTRISPDLFTDPAKAGKIANQLEPADRPVWSRYVLSRAMSGMPFGSIQILNSQGKDPATVGEALTLTRNMMKLEAERDAKMEAASKRQAEISQRGDWGNSAEGVAAYNAAVKDYNAAIEEFDLKAGVKKPK